MIEKIKASWEDILSFIKNEYELTQVSFKTFLLPLEPYRLRTTENGEQVLDLVVKDDDKQDQFFKTTINKKYFWQIAVALQEITGIECGINILLKDEIKKEREDSRRQERIFDDTKRSVPPEVIQQSNLNPKYTFDTFVVGKSNNIAHAASLAVAESPGDIWNPLFIYGGSGLGKTHLMQAIAHFILEKDPEKKVMYVTTETFTNDLINAIRHNSTEEFRLKYRSNDVLLLDDVQFIIGKDSTQEELFNTFNDLHQRNKQIIFTSDRPPSEFTTLEERLSSRFGWGMTVDIQMPDYETRMAILRRKAEAENYNIDNEILKYIAENVKKNIRELESALNKVAALKNLLHMEVTLEAAKDILKDTIYPEEKREVTPELIMNVVCDHYSVSHEDLVSAKRNKELVRPRQVAMYLMRNMTSASLEMIGKYLGDRDHTTVMHGIDKISTELGSGTELAGTVDILKKKVSSQ